MKERHVFAAVVWAMAIAGIAAVVGVSGADGIATVAITLLVCEFVGAVARELRGEREPASSAARLGAMLVLLCAATLLDAATSLPGVFRIGGAALGLVLSVLPRHFGSADRQNCARVSRLPVRPAAPIMGAKYHVPVRTQPCMSSYRRGRRPGLYNAPQRSASMKAAMASR